MKQLFIILLLGLAACGTTRTAYEQAERAGWPRAVLTRIDSVDNKYTYYYTTDDNKRIIHTLIQDRSTGTIGECYRVNPNPRQVKRY